MYELFSKGQYSAYLKAYSTLPERKKQDAEACYFAGHAWLRLHKPELAEPLLSRALKSDDAETCDLARKLLNDVAAMKRLAPGNSCQIRNGSFLKMQVFAGDSIWTQSLLDALPQFLTRAVTIFGDELPQIDFYFFGRRSRFEQFFKLMFAQDIPTGWLNGTGNSNIVVFCEQNGSGQCAHAPGHSRTFGDVLHEYGHALCTTIYGDTYLDLVPQWLNEGLADAIAAPYYEELFRQSEHFLHAYAQDHAPPTYNEICHNLYDHPAVGYAIARFMVQNFAGEENLSAIKKVIERAQQTGNFERAVADATGIGARSHYKSVIKKYWRS